MPTTIFHFIFLAMKFWNNVCSCEKIFNINGNKDDDNDDDKIENQEEEHELEDKNWPI